MNPIRFRAWDKVRKKMGKVVAMDWDTYDNIITAHIEYYDGTVMKTYPNDDYGDQMVFMQDTGFVDKNKEKIYQGDILRWYGHEVKDGKQIRPERLLVVADYIRDAHKVLCITEGTDQTVEIIGNIYEHKYLLEVE